MINLLLKYGASPMGRDTEGAVLDEALKSRNPGSVALLTELLSWTDSDVVTTFTKSHHNKATKHAMKYWIQRSSRHLLPAKKLTQLGVPRLNALKYKVVGQDFAIDNVQPCIS